MKPLVSAIIPTHNRAALLPEALASVYAQDGRGEEFELEVIVVDDASSDATPEVVRRFSGVRYIRLDRNRGPAAARNAGIKASSGAYIAFCDDDDLWLPYRLRLQVPMLEANPEAGVVYGQTIFRFEGNESVGPSPDQAPSGMIFREVLMGFLPHVCSMLIRREAFEKAGTFDETFRHGEDYNMVGRLAFHVPFLFVPQPVYIYRLSRAHSLWMTALARGEIAADLRSVESVVALLPDSEDYKDLKLEARARGRLWLAKDLGRVRNFERMHEHLRAALEMFPALIGDQSARRMIVDMAQSLVEAADSPLEAIRNLCAEVKTIPRRRHVRGWARMRSLLADVWVATASQLRSTSPRCHWVIGYAIARALFCNPAKFPELVARGLRRTLRLMIWKSAE